MKSLLFSGNREVQEGLCCSLRDTREETLFLNLKHRIEIATLNYKETYVSTLSLSLHEYYELNITYMLS